MEGAPGQGFAGGDPLFDLRHYFYPGSRDPVIAQLATADSVAEVLEVVAGVEEVSTRHLTQAVATIHHLQKLAHHLAKADHDDEYRELVVTFNSHLRASPLYSRLLELIHQRVTSFPHVELAFLLMGLRKVQEPLCSPVLRDIFLHLQAHMATLDLEALSYLSVGLRPRFYQLDSYRLVWRMAMAQSLPRLQEHLLACSSAEQLKRIAICFSNLSSIVSDRLMEELAARTTAMVVQGELAEAAHLPTLAKLVALVVNKSEWHQQHGDYVRLLTSQLQGRTELLRPVQVVMLARVLLLYGEPADLYHEVFHRLVEVVSSRQYEGNVPMISCISLILRMNNSAMPLAEVEALLEDIISGPHLTDHISEVYDIVRSVGLIRPSLMARFFERALEQLRDQPYELLRFGLRYTNYFSPYTGTYRNANFEAQLGALVAGGMAMVAQAPDRKVKWRDLENNKMGVHPDEFAGKLRLLLSCGVAPDAAVLARLEDFLPNMGLSGHNNLSRGVESYRKRRGADAAAVEVLAERVVEVRRELVRRRVSGSQHCQQALRPSDLPLLLEEAKLAELAEGEEGVGGQAVEVVARAVAQGQMSTGQARQLANTAAREGAMGRAERARLVNLLVAYMLAGASPRQVHVSFTYKLVFAATDLGIPLPPAFLSLVDASLVRDLRSFPGLHTLQLARALCHHDTLSRELARAVFSAEFMRKLDKEMELCGTATSYPGRLRRTLMEVNRAVVLRRPAYGVPWFHQEYCIEHTPALKRKWRVAHEKAGTAAFREELYEALCQALGGWRFVREDTATKYFNTMDFEVVMDERGRPVDLVTNQGAVGGRVAVVAVPATMYHQDRQTVEVEQAVRCTELELEGWRVVRPDPFLWASLEGAARAAHLRRLLGAGGGGAEAWEGAL